MSEKMEWINFKIDIGETESILKYTFNNKDLLKEALESYHRLDRLEFLGDTVLEFMIAINVYRICQVLDKPKLAWLVRKNVKNCVLGRVAIDHGFHNFLLNEDKSKAIECYEKMRDISISDGDVKPPKVLANVIEALVGAVHVDNEFSFDKVWQVFRPLLSPKMKDPENKAENKAVGIKETVLPQVSSSSKYPFLRETAAVDYFDSSKDKPKSEECKCYEVKKFIDNLMPPNILDEMEEKLNYNFKNRNLLKVAFCKRSDLRALFSAKICQTCEEAIELAGLKSYGSMELLGHLSLKIAVTKYLYNKYPDIQPDKLTRLRSQIMDSKILARVAIVNLEVTKYLTFTHKSQEDKVLKFNEDIRNNSKDLNPPMVLCYIVESMAGAMFLDSNGVSLEITCSVLEKVWEKFKVLLEPLATPETLETHPVSELQELCHKNSNRIEYKDHKFKLLEDEMIAVEVFIDDEIVGRGENRKKDVAKRIAARNALENLNVQGKKEAVRSALEDLNVKGEKN